MRLRRRTRAGHSRARVVGSIVTLSVLAACSGHQTVTPPPSTSTPVVVGSCGTFTIAYSPSDGYEASAFIVGTIAADQLGCHVSYVKTTARAAWHLVASGRADVYMDAYGVPKLRAKLTRRSGPVTFVGANGIRGSVDLLAPEFMADKGLTNASDLSDPQRIGWGTMTPSITTTPQLVPLARAFIGFQHLDEYVVRDVDRTDPHAGIGALIRQPREDDASSVPGLYLLEAPTQLLGDRTGQQIVSVPASADEPCAPDKASTLCSFADFNYIKIANSQFARSGSPAYSLVFNYHLDEPNVATVLELVALSGYQVSPADVASWINTHRQVWRRWLK